MRKAKETKILFCGYAPVHFLCYRPVYELLAREPGFRFFFSGPERLKRGEAEEARPPERLYRQFGVPRREILSPAEALAAEVDVTVCSFVSGLFPRRDRLRVHLFHGASFRNMAVRQDILAFDRLFGLGPYQRRLFEESRILRPGDSRFVPIGFPKLDPLTDGTLDRRAILRRAGFSGRRPVILYAPTGQRFNSLELMGEEVLRRLAGEGRYDILVKTHDHPRDGGTDWAARLRALEGPHLRLARDYDVVPYLFASDLLLTDASSVSSEYALLDRPMVFIDVPQMLQAVTEKGLAVDADRGRSGGLVARWPDEVVRAVREGLARPGARSRERRALAAELFYNPGRAAAAARDWLLAWREGAA